MDQFFIRVILCVCGLHLSLTSCASHNKTPLFLRVIRSGPDTTKPTPINCKLGPWSAWTSCNACSKEKSRFRSMERAAQFEGSQCLADGQLWEREGCPVVDEPCLVDDICGEDFTCGWTERCVSQELRCNGEHDCQDGSDEDDCEALNLREDRCSTLPPIPGAERAVRGYNIVTGDFMVRVLDHTYFGGQCEYVYNGEWRKFTYDAMCENLSYNDEFKHFRKPYNYHTYRFMAQARSEGSYEAYEDAVSLLNARKTHDSSNVAVTFGFFFLEAGVTSSKETEVFTNITQHNSADLIFVRLQSKVQTAQFKMRSRGLMLDEDMHRALLELPGDYDVATYFLFLKTYGTHYVTEGTVGGVLEYVVVLNKTAMASSNTDGEKVASCLGGHLGVSFKLFDMLSFRANIGGESCSNLEDWKPEKGSSSNEIKDIITLVRGGIAETDPNMLSISDQETYRKWGESLQYSPALIEYETMPIYELVRRSTAARYLGPKLVHLRRAWDEYQLQFSACRCAPCRHNGTPALRGTTCSCLCRKGYRGSACQETDRPDRRTDGQWSCWGAWSACGGGAQKKWRTRACNNPPPDRGGAKCLGQNSQGQRC